ncbi:MAG: hypothetical protein WCO75_03000 [Planctomycetota bacterium]
MKNTTFAVSAFASLSTLVIASVASAAVVVINNHATWDMYTALQGATVATEDFESFSANSSPDSAFGTAGATTWTADSNGGLYFGDVNVPPTHRVISTAVANRTLNFTFAPGVQGIGGEMFGTDFSLGCARPHHCDAR